MRLRDRYDAALRAGGRADDPAQRAVLERLAALEDCLLAAPRTSLLGRWFATRRRGFHHPGACRGLYLWGGVGRGKTWLMDLFQAGLPRTDARRLHFAHFMREVHARRRRLGRQERPLDGIAAQLARHARVYCLDEFMVQDIGDAMILHGLLEGLVARGVVLVITSNTPPSRLYAGGLQRERFLPAIALLERQLDVVEMGAGEDFRQRQLQQSRCWYDAAAPDTPAAMAALFGRLAGAADDTGAGSLLVEDRPIATLRQAGSMAWFAFADLCEGPRSADDYIALAGRLHTVFLSDVPVFDATRDDAARRFIALIDELYDRRVRLVVSAAAEPGDLYRGERLRGPFERTTSRLLEMRSAAYRAAAPPAGGRERQ